MRILETQRPPIEEDLFQSSETSFITLFAGFIPQKRGFISNRRRWGIAWWTMSQHPDLGNTCSEEPNERNQMLWNMKITSALLPAPLPLVINAQQVPNRSETGRRANEPERDSSGPEFEARWNGVSLNVLIIYGGKVHGFNPATLPFWKRQP